MVINMALTNEDLNAIESMLEPIKCNIRSLQLTLKNETNHNIIIIAEDRLDLSRKLDDALKIDNDFPQKEYSTCHLRIL